MSTKDGTKGEDLAALFLSEKGYSILSRNYRSRYGEIDIIAMKDNLVCFVEVKTRRNSGFARAADSVGRSKIDRLKKTAQIWLCAHDPDYICRFDVIEVYGLHEEPIINHIEAAFE